MTKTLSKRLKGIANYVKKGSFIADIGSDHAHIPIYLLDQGLIKGAICSEVAQGPYERMCQAVLDNHYGDQVSCRLGNGLATLKKEDPVDTVIIAGMGGKLIHEILLAGEEILSQLDYPKLILQANIDEYLLRQWLLDQSYKIVGEDILEDAGKIYEIIVAEYVGKAPDLSDSQIYLGLYTQASNPAIFRKKWTRRQHKIESILQQMSGEALSERRQQFSQQLAMIKQALEGESDDQ
ncbi:tRNA (adenine(22)-N(1))-methyltransferase [Aerococcus urinae]|uniref:tRNA (adenine(22)-N(1))-methyltransferase n=1 Tax=Aerococcus urinae TaxID=1376 RepID=UPI00227B2FC9|nr:tRNA (adenine(22)-N(1))-methyltransferase TrmK [Aerococcus urinae]MCY3048320.1 tRNA (adenine(22)-N(1))-methyltransferase TrmK [Aerococcus urinae]